MQFLVITLTVVLIIAGLIGCIVPVLPGPLLILIGAFLYAWFTDFAVINWVGLSVLGLLALSSQVLDHLASSIGAKKFGASQWGVVGAFVGGIIGLFVGGIIGILIGPFLGAIFFEIIQGKGFHASLKIGFGTFIGFLGGTFGKVVIAITMVGIFLAYII